MPNVKLSLKKYNLIINNISRKCHNRRFAHQYLVAQQEYLREAKDTWQTWGEPSVTKYLSDVDTKKKLKAVLD